MNKFNRGEGVQYPMSRPTLALPFILLLFAGCLSPDRVPLEKIHNESGSMAPVPAGRFTLVHQAPSFGYAGSVECVGGPGSPMARAPGAFIGQSVKHVEFSIDVPPTTSGVQIGYSLDNGTIQWLATAFNEKAHFSIDVPTDAIEKDSFRWTFYYSQNVKGAEQPCYTGVSTAREDILIEAVS